MIVVTALYGAFLALVGKAPKELMQALLVLAWGLMALGTVGSFFAALAGKI